ncbi:MAG: HD-GYP domain-containing protein, partial [Leptospira sp.]|nr:HD-GYP domain-containing protein [Leptospira sp.]
MKVIKVSDLKPGTSFNKPVYLDKDIIFVNSNVIISEGDIERLNKFGITEVSTDGEVNKANPIPVVNTDIDPFFPKMEKADPNLPLRNIYEQVTKNKNSFSNIYREAFETVQYVYKQAAEDKTIEISAIREISEKLAEHVKANPNLSFNILNLNPTGYFLYNQVVQATLYSMIIGAAMDYSKPKLVELGTAALFADIGMSKIPAFISEKAAALSEDEFKVVIKHTVIGYQILTKSVKLKNNLALVALQHHEKFDGTGYPQKISGAVNIEEYTRIFTIADNFSAQTNPRPWRRKILPYEAIKNMISVEMNKYDLKILRLFLNKVSMYPVGSYVKLSDDQVAIVIDSNPSKPLRPSLKVVQDASGGILQSLQFVNLLND